jgi:hypothetical protein
MDPGSRQQSIPAVLDKASPKLSNGTPGLYAAQPERRNTHRLSPAQPVPSPPLVDSSDRLNWLSFWDGPEGGKPGNHSRVARDRLRDAVRRTPSSRGAHRRSGPVAQARQAR